MILHTTDEFTDSVVDLSLCGKSFETQCGRIPIDPAILAAIGHRFVAKQNKEN